MDGQYVSFPQRPPDEAVPAISKLYNSVHRRIASIVSNTASTSAQTEALSDGESLSAKTGNSVDISESPTLDPSSPRRIQPRNHDIDDMSSISNENLRQFQFPRHEVSVSHASQGSSQRGQSAMLMHAPQKAAPSVQSELLTALGDLDYLDTPSSSPTKGPGSDLVRHADNSVPGFALERELSSESEPPSSPAQDRRPSISREDSISTVLTRLKTGALSKEFWMKDQNAHACFRCEATFNSKNNH